MSVYVDDPTVIHDHYMDLPASVHADLRDYCATLGIWNDKPRLNWHWVGKADPPYGSASRGE